MGALRFKIIVNIATIAALVACTDAGKSPARRDGNANANLNQSTSEAEGSAQSAIQNSGALDDNVKVPNLSEVQAMIAADAKASAAKNTIYVDIHHLAKSEKGTSDLEVVRFALAKTLNSVSLNPKIVKISPIDEARTVYRVNLDDYTLSSSWSLIAGSKYNEDNLSNNSNVITVKGDWLVYALTRPEVYDAIMRIPQAVPLLESALKVDRSKSIYVNVSESGVTFKGRIIERMPLEIGGKPGGYYWRSYDFGLDASRIAGFAEPATLQAASATILPLVAGEYIFSLPNGMQAYMLSGFALQTRHDAQLFVATDPRRPQDALDHCVDSKRGCGFVINGESCMTCHKLGLNAPKKIDGIKPAGSDATIKSLIAADEARFVAALTELGFDPHGPEPIYEVLKMYRDRSQIEDKRAQAGEFEGAIQIRGTLLQR